MGTFRWPVAMTALMAAVMVLAACGASASVESATNVAPTAAAEADDAGRPVFASPTPVETTGDAPAGGGLPQQLAAFGELAALRSRPLTAVFGPTGGSLSLSDGATVTVPGGAFAADTEMSVSVVDLLFGHYMGDPPDGRVYVLSTVEDTPLGRPVVVEVPKQRESVTVSQLLDGRWVSIEGSAGPTTRIEITHFSSNVFSVIDRPVCPGDAARAFCAQDQLWGDWFVITDGEPAAGNLVTIDDVPAATLLLPYFEACRDICPNLAVPPGSGRPATAATSPTPAPSPTSADSPPTPAPTEVPGTGTTPVPTRVATPVPTTAPTPRPTPRPTPTSALPACEAGYTRRPSGDCRTVGNGCVYPALDFSGRSGGCIFRVECAPPSAGYRIVDNNTCIFTPPGSCPSGWSPNGSGQCVTPRFRCVHPQLDYPAEGRCIPPSECRPESAGYRIVGSECVYELSNGA